MIAGSAVSLFWLFFVQEKTSGSLRICRLLFGIDSVVKDTPLHTLAMVDAIVIALPLSIIAALIAWAVIGSAKESQQAPVTVSAD